MAAISLLIPVYNEDEKLEGCVSSSVKYLKRITDDYEIIVSEDGSTDNTLGVAKKLSKKNRKIKVLHSPNRLGKGGGITKAVKSSSGKIIVSIDVDMATDMSHLRNLVKGTDDYDIVIGSRMIAGSDVKRAFLRDVASHGYNFLVGLFFNSHVNDHQCGFKAFRRNVIMSLVDEVNNMSWFWDTEILVRAQMKGYRVKEIPIKWRQSDESKIRLYKDIFSMGKDILNFWWELRNE